MKAYRLCAPWRDPRDPAGAVRRGGRWNSPGNPVLYCASSLSLACLETLVHIRDTSNIPALSYSESSMPDHQIARWEDHCLGPRHDLRTAAMLESLVLSRESGDGWLRSSSTLVLQVPSAVIPEEWNYLVNPGLPRFEEISWSLSKPFRIDVRLLDPNIR